MISVKQHLQGEINKDKTNVLRNTITSLGLENIDVEQFEKEFGKMDIEEMAEFILDTEKHFLISLWSTRLQEKMPTTYDKRVGLDGRIPTEHTYEEDDFDR